MSIALSPVKAPISSKFNTRHVQATPLLWAFELIGTLKPLPADEK